VEYALRGASAGREAEEGRNIGRRKNNPEICVMNAQLRKEGKGGEENGDLSHSELGSQDPVGGNRF